MARRLLFVLALAACDRRDPGSSANAQHLAEQVAAQPSGQPAAASPSRPTEPAAAPVTSPACERARDAYVAWQRERVRGAIGPEESARQQELQAVADQELARAEKNFPAACSEMGAALDTTCFSNRRAREGACKTMLRDLGERLLRR